MSLKSDQLEILFSVIYTRIFSIFGIKLISRTGGIVLILNSIYRVLAVFSFSSEMV